MLAFFIMLSDCLFSFFSGNNFFCQIQKYERKNLFFKKIKEKKVRMSSCQDMTKSEVMKWLKEHIFEGQSVPIFDHNKATFDELFKLKTSFEEEHYSKSVIYSVQEAQIGELKDETVKMKQRIASIGFETMNLEPLVQVLAQTTELLSVDDPGETALNLAIGDLRFSASKLPLQNHLSRIKHRKDTKNIIEDSSFRSKTEQALNIAKTEAGINQEDMAKVFKKSAFHQEKQREYLELREKCVTIIRKHGFQRHLSHDSIEEMQKSLQAIDEESKPMSLKLEAFKGLPPSLELASAKLAEKEKVLQDLNNLLQKEIQNIHL